MNNVVTWYMIGMIIGSCVTLTAVSAVNMKKRAATRLRKMLGVVMPR